MKQKTKNKKGFTLVEAIVYLAIVGILLTAVVSFNLTLGNTAVKVGAGVETSRNRRIALNAIDYLVKNADGMLKDTSGDCSTFGASPQALALYFENDDYLPGTCVKNGGGVRVTLSDRRIVMACYPNMNGNGHYNNCSVDTFAVGNKYYLSSDDVEVLDTSLTFATSTATSTANSNINITTTLSVSSQNNRQAMLSATSTASSTVVVYSEKPSGLVTWWRLEEGTGTTTVDSIGDNPAGCYPPGSTPTWAAGIVDGSTYALDFEYDDDPSTCITYDPATESTTDPDDLNFSDQFTITAWVKPEAFNGSVQHKIMSKTQWAYQRGYVMELLSTTEAANCKVFDGTTYVEVASADSSIVVGNTYHIACVYDLNNNRLQVYVYEKDTGPISSVIYDGTVPILVNDTYEPHLSYSGTSGTFDGIIDEVRFYNRALTDEEISALQSQGDY
ncbi:hypothetical protein HON36_05715 [Candidatus Parcubacteria bacterium]|jgi:type II secretory pathway pseudopilin PulG|nr:hypothetical protein [Candidatus Parcubacteria bacterium]MBT7228896.1 hypothetical protein [Candidatus Parcubacteria bacterium]